MTVNYNIPIHEFERYSSAQEEAARRATLIPEECRSILVYALVMAFYLKDNRYKGILEKDAWEKFSTHETNCIKEFSLLPDNHSTVLLALNDLKVKDCC